jgi:serine phosphatase RsbU (regulator of sigma subunit)/catechol 2,3-dioxygenase-like lactoylglutathione lyase family enzyme
MDSGLADFHGQNSAQCQYVRIFKTNVFVSDQDRSIRFFVDQLGFSVVGDARFEFDRWVAIAPPDGSSILAVIAPKPGSPHHKLIGRPTHIGFIAEDIYATYRLWLSRGVEFIRPPQPQLWGGIFAEFCDLDGNTFDLIASDAMSKEIEAQRLAAAERVEQERRRTLELEIAKQVQMRLFPQTYPPLRTLEYAGICIQARHVGGDYYDFFALGQNRLGLLIGDISGKGVAAALLMANLQANLRSQFAIAREQPHGFLKCVNRLFYENTVDSAYATLFFGEYDDTTSRLRYTNCGHLPGLILRRNDSIEWLPSTGTVLGLFRDWESPTVECELRPDDILVLYTDGVTESCDANGQEFGEECLAEAVKRHRSQVAQEMVRSIVTDLEKFSSGEQFDDVTLIVAKCRD